LSEIWAKVIKIVANLIRFGQNRNLASQKHQISYGYEWHFKIRSRIQ